MRLHLELHQQYRSSAGYRDAATGGLLYLCAGRGSPVGPICNPGLAAIEAAVEPASEVDGEDITGCFYFAHATVSGEPITLYARTQEEHDRNRQRYNIY